MPLAKEQLCGRGTCQILESTEDLALKAYVVACSASRTLGEVELAAAIVAQLTTRNKELTKPLELAEGAKAALEREKKTLERKCSTLTLRVNELEQSLTTAPRERDELAEEAR